MLVIDHRDESAPSTSPIEPTQPDHCSPAPSISKPPSARLRPTPHISSPVIPTPSPEDRPTPLPDVASPEEDPEVPSPQDILPQLRRKPKSNTGGQLAAKRATRTTRNATKSTYTGGKGQCSRPVHHKYIARKWTKYHAYTCPAHHKYIQNFPCQCSCNFPGLGNVQYIRSVLDHMTTMLPSIT